MGLAAACGIPPSDLLRAGPIERALLMEALTEAQEHQKRYIRAQAIECVNAYAQAIKK